MYTGVVDVTLAPRFEHHLIACVGRPLMRFYCGDFFFVSSWSCFVDRNLTVDLTRYLLPPPFLLIEEVLSVDAPAIMTAGSSAGAHGRR